MVWVPLDGDDEFPTLGYQVADWMTEFLLRPDTSEQEPFVPTLEQIEFLAELYRLDPFSGRRVIHRAVLSRPRGWGKSPFVAGIAAAEAMGPVRCDGFDAQGQPVGVPWSYFRTPRVALAATTEDQVANTFDALKEMIELSPAEFEFGAEVQTDRVVLPRGEIEVVSASATSIKGKRHVAAVLDQTETWLPGNRGVKLAQTMRNNATKLNGVTVETPNAFTIGEGSVAERSAKFHEQIQAGKVKDGDAKRSFLYDHRSAPLDTDQGDHGSLIEGLRVAYGDSAKDPRGCAIHEPSCPPGWVNLERIAADFWDTSNDPAQMSADFLNIIGAASDSWVTGPELRAIEDSSKVISGVEPVTLGFDGSEGRQRGIADSTVLIGYSVAQKHIFKVGVWEQPDGPAGEGWQPPVLEVEQTVKEFFESHNVVGFYADPSAGWAGLVKDWEATYSKRLRVHASSKEKPVEWPKRLVNRTCEGFAQLLSEIRQGTVTYDGDPVLTRHFLNARKDPRRAGYVLKKADDNQDYGKIDASYGAMFAYYAGLDAIGKGVLKARVRRKIPRRIR